jgi:hypothetical protein
MAADRAAAHTDVQHVQQLLIALIRFSAARYRPGRAWA